MKTEDMNKMVEILTCLGDIKPTDSKILYHIPLNKIKVTKSKKLYGAKQSNRQMKFSWPKNLVLFQDGKWKKWVEMHKMKNSFHGRCGPFSIYVNQGKKYTANILCDYKHLSNIHQPISVPDFLDRYLYCSML